MQVLDAIDERAIDDLIARDEFFWLDLVDPTPEQLTGLAQRFGWHPLALEDMNEQRQRPKLDRYDDQMLIVFYGVHATRDLSVEPGSRPHLIEVHLMVSGRWVVTVRQQHCPQLDELRRRLGQDSGRDEKLVVYRILDTLDRHVLPRAGADRRRDRHAGGQNHPAADRQTAAGRLLPQAAPRRAAPHDHAAARPRRAHDRGDRGSARPGGRRRATTSATSTTT